MLGHSSDTDGLDVDLHHSDGEGARPAMERPGPAATRVPGICFMRIYMSRLGSLKQQKMEKRTLNGTNHEQKNFFLEMVVYITTLYGTLMIKCVQT